MTPIVSPRFLISIALLAGYAAGSQVSAIQGHDQFRIDHTEYQEQVSRLENRLVLAEAHAAELEKKTIKAEDEE